MSMPYRRLGRSGLKVSLLSFGSWVSFANQLDDNLAVRCLEAAREGGVNFFDNAESYAGGEAEAMMGRAIRTLGWPRHEYVVSSKFFWGLHDTPNMRNTLNRKYLMQAVDASLERFGLEFLDLIFCHRSDPETPIEETVWAMSDIISSGRALYWGTSEWAASEIVAAFELAERHHLHKPVTEQTQYNLLERRRVEQEYARVIKDYGLGITAFSPLASGLLTGKYLAGIPEGSRGALAGYEWLRPSFEDPRRRRNGPGSQCHRGRPRLPSLPTRHCLVRVQPERLERDHGREPRRTARGEPAVPRSARATGHRGDATDQRGRLGHLSDGGSDLAENPPKSASGSAHRPAEKGRLVLCRRDPYPCIEGDHTFKGRDDRVQAEFHNLGEVLGEEGDPGKHLFQGRKIDRGRTAVAGEKRRGPQPAHQITRVSCVVIGTSDQIWSPNSSASLPPRPNITSGPKDESSKSPTTVSTPSGPLAGRLASRKGRTS